MEELLVDIAKQVISWILSNAYDEALTATADPTNPLEVLMKEVLRRTGEQVKQAIAENDLARTETSTKTVITILEEYKKSPGDPGRLATAQALNLDVINQLIRIELPGTLPFLAAVNTQMIIYRNRFLVYGAREKDVARSELQTDIGALDDLVKNWTAYEDSRVGVTVREHGTTRAYFVVLDGQVISPPYKQEHGAQVQAAVKRKELFASSQGARALEVQPQWMKLFDQIAGW
jgi:hypothetical protein